MTSRLPLAGAVIALLTGLLLFGGRSVFEADPSVAAAAEPGPGIEDYMVSVHGPQGFWSDLGKLLPRSGNAPSERKWKQVKSRAIIMDYLIEGVLEKKKPPQGAEDSWKEKLQIYRKNIQDLAAAAAKMDFEAAKELKSKIAKNCTACHEVHRP